jgi:hypothetical protein
MRMRRWYTKEEIQFVKENIPRRSYAEMRILFNKRFHLRLTKKQFDTLMYKHKIHNGLGTWNGYAPLNKGKKHKPQQGNYKAIDYERIQLGYVWVKVGNKKYGGHKNWKAKHVALYEKAHGKPPKGHVVIFADGNNRNFDLNNLLLISRKELCVMNSCGLICKHRDLTVIGKTIADIKMAMNKRKRNIKNRAVRTACP